MSSSPEDPNMNRIALFVTSVIALLALSTAPALAADFVWTTEQVTATRFMEADSEIIGPIEANLRVEVLHREGNLIRVKLPTLPKFGWIDASKTTETGPEGGELPFGLPADLGAAAEPAAEPATEPGTPAPTP